MLRLLIAMHISLFTFIVILAFLSFYIKIKKGEILFGIINIVILLILYLVSMKTILLKVM